MTIPFSAIVAGNAEGLKFVFLDRPFEGTRPIDHLWGPKPGDFDAWFCHERGPEAGGIIEIAEAHVFGTDLVYVERHGQTCILEIDQNFLSQAPGLAELNRMHALLADGTLRHREIDGESVLLSGHPYNLYGHWLVDFMPRLQLLRQGGLNLGELQFLLPADLPDFALSWLLLAGIGAEQLVMYDPATELCRCERALMPTNLRLGGRALPIMSEAAKWMTQVTDAQDVAATRLLYISRENWANITRKLENWEAVESEVEKYGFDIVFPEKLSIAEQAKLLASARFVAGDYGSGLHNTIFSRPRTQVIALRGTYLHPGFLQSGLCETSRQSLSYVFGRTWANEQGFQHYEIDLDDLKRCLDITMRTML